MGALPKTQVMSDNPPERIQAAERHKSQDAATALQTCRGWAWFKRSIQARLDGLRASLESEDTPLDKVPGIRGEIKGLKESLAIPERTVDPSKLPGADNE